MSLLIGTLLWLLFSGDSTYFPLRSNGHFPLMRIGARLSMSNGGHIYKSVSYHWEVSFSLSTGDAVAEGLLLIFLLLFRFRLSIIFTGSPSYPEIRMSGCMSIIMLCDMTVWNTTVK